MQDTVEQILPEHIMKQTVDMPVPPAPASSSADLSAAAASVAAARAKEEALLAELLEAETNMADLAAHSLLIEEAQQAARTKKNLRRRSKLLRQRKKTKTKR